MNIWVDADACPAPVKDILYRAAERVGVTLILVANHNIRVPVSPFIKAVQVSQGFDIADNTIAQAVQVEDLVITADIPLAADVIARGARALNPRGELYTPDNIKERLAMRDLMNELRGSGINSGGPAPLTQRDRQAFANQLDRLLNIYQREQ